MTTLSSYVYAARLNACAVEGRYSRDDLGVVKAGNRSPYLSLSKPLRVDVDLILAVGVSGNRLHPP